MMAWWQTTLVVSGVYWFIGFLVLKCLDPWKLGDVIAMMLDHRHRNMRGVLILLAIGWFTWPIQLVWRKKQ